jgi:hypothetical protein
VFVYQLINLEGGGGCFFATLGTRVFSAHNSLIIGRYIRQPILELKKEGSKRGLTK